MLRLSFVAWYDSGAGARVVHDRRQVTAPPRSALRARTHRRQGHSLQCVYHGWYFDGARPLLSVPKKVHKNNVVQNNILWFYPTAEP
ncbi:hypothetical protein EJB05_22038 [Eragrostis curvula]|uniref:Rieske domain-containing protein n=1 Tax=Eragrostis curvula TaxID=38414 RepID=A0A5J9V3D4_9POAL|nr:hypothetical protein EJB05_22038 [Eragrostis curvula]